MSNESIPILDTIRDGRDAIIIERHSPKSVSMSETAFDKLVQELETSNKISVFSLACPIGIMPIYGLEIIIDDMVQDDEISIAYEEL